MPGQSVRSDKVYTRQNLTFTGQLSNDRLHVICRLESSAKKGFLFRRQQKRKKTDIPAPTATRTFHFVIISTHLRA